MIYVYVNKKVYVNIIIFLIKKINKFTKLKKI